MAKNKNSEGKSGAKKIPKRIAGVKIPKGLRESGNAAVKLAQSPMARELLAAGLAAAAAAVAANKRARDDAQRSGGEAAKAFADVTDAAAKSAGEIKAALVEAAGVAAQQFFSGKFKASAGTTKTPDADYSSVGQGTATTETELSAPLPIEADGVGSPVQAPVANGSGARPARTRAAKPPSTTTTPQ